MVYSNGNLAERGGTKALVISNETSTTLFNRRFYRQDGADLYISVLFENNFAYALNHFFDIGFQTADGVQPSAAILHRSNAALSQLTFGIAEDVSDRTDSPFATSSGTVYLAVLKLHKSAPGAANAFNVLSLFVNPSTLGEPVVPTLTMTDSQLASFDRLALRTANMAPTDRYYIDNIRVGRTWQSVVSPRRGAVVAVR
jgi:hypothetical protein